jgi:hypothetical protein
VIFLFEEWRIWVPVPEDRLGEGLEALCGISYISECRLMADVYLKALGGEHKTCSIYLDDYEIWGVENRVSGDDNIATLFEICQGLWVFVGHKYAKRRGHQYVQNKS